MILKTKRKTKWETRHNKDMGTLITTVTRIKLYLFGLIPIKTIHEYRETMHGNIKDLEDCNLTKT